MTEYDLTGEVVKLITSPTMCLQLGDKILVILRIVHPIMLVIEGDQVTEISQRNSPALFNAILNGFESRGGVMISEEEVKCNLLLRI